MTAAGSTIAAIFSIAIVVFFLEYIILGQPPKHCHYFVPVIGKPGIYSCSLYPHPVKP